MARSAALAIDATATPTRNSMSVPPRPTKQAWETEQRRE